MNAVEVRTQLYPRRHIEMTPSLSLCYTVWLQWETKKNDLISNLIIEFIQIMLDEWTLCVRGAEWEQI